ncbi:iron chelate uptake ABC transporter family permease subunit [bacterium]|nr:iron chelate uptake ABC transporter family permease subunit [bacterium]
MIQELLRYNTLIILAGTSLLGLVSGLVGTLAVLRRRALAGDALAHATLPGLCIAFLVVGHRHLPSLLLGAACTGLFGLACVSILCRSSRIKDDAALALVLGVFFGAGIVLSRWIQNRATEGSKAGLDSFLLGKTSGMILADVELIAAVSAFVLIVIVALFKEFQVTLFDTAFARATGWPTGTMDLLLMLLIGLVVVAGLPSVGVVLITSLLVIPAAAARFWTDRFETMALISSILGMIACVSGVVISTLIEDLPTGALMTLCATGLFVVSALFSPRGVIARRYRSSRGEGNETNSAPFHIAELPEGA